MSKELETAYVVHPVSAEIKAALRAKGFKIVDAAFAPEDAEIITPYAIHSGLNDELGTDSGDQFSDDQLRQSIEAATGKTPHPKMKRDNLIAHFNKLNAAARY